MKYYEIHLPTTNPRTTDSITTQTYCGIVPQDLLDILFEFFQNKILSNKLGSTINTVSSGAVTTAVTECQFCSGICF